MSSTPMEPSDPFETAVADAVRAWTELGVVPIDAAVIARDVTGPGAAGSRRSITGRWALTGITRLAAPAAVAAVAVAGILLSAGPRTSQGPGGPASHAPPTAGPAAATEFRARVELRHCASAPSGDATGEQESCRLVVVETTDPRIEGAGEVQFVRVAHPGGPTLLAASFVIEDEKGAWRQDGRIALVEADGRSTTTTVTFLGEGGFEGESMVAEVAAAGDTWELRGVIVDLDVSLAPHRPPPVLHADGTTEAASPAPFAITMPGTQAWPSAPPASGGV